jgi:hypothetical protein
VQGVQSKEVVTITCPGCGKTVEAVKRSWALMLSPDLLGIRPPDITGSTVSGWCASKGVMVSLDV